jgi:hypothetical protein
MSLARYQEAMTRVQILPETENSVLYFLKHQPLAHLFFFYKEGG